MPELPEVETVVCGIKPYLLNRTIDKLIVRNRKLRWTVEAEMEQKVAGHKIVAITRRGKYILIKTSGGCIIVHLGMSGVLRVCTEDTPVGNHDHIDIRIRGDGVMRYHDPRRFGAWLWTDADPGEHRLIREMGVEPLDPDFNADYLYQQIKVRKSSIKSLITNAKIVSGIGNIYASEILFAAAVRPHRRCCDIEYRECVSLAGAVKNVLNDAIQKGGTTLKDFTDINGMPGYFTQELQVYGRENQACYHCGGLIQKIVITQRSSFYCPQCQH